MVIEIISLPLTMAALKGMTGALAPFSYLVYNKLAVFGVKSWRHFGQVTAKGV